MIGRLRGGNGPGAEELLVPVLAVITAMLIGMGLIALAGGDPIQAYGALFSGMLGGPDKIALTLVKATPLILTGLAVAFAFRAGLFNIGGNGQFIVGMVAAGWFAWNFPNLPMPLHLPIELVAAAVAGGIWGAIAGWLKSVRGAHEVITTIMLNFIAIRIAEYLFSVGSPFHDPESTNPQSPPFVPSSGLPVLWQDEFGAIQVHFGLIVALGMALLAWFILARTTLGYKIRAIGLNPDAAEYGGVNVTRTVVVAMAISGAFAGLAGAGFAVGELSSLSKTDFSLLGHGFAGIAVALLGRNTVPGVIIAALLFGGLEAGAVEMQFAGGLESGVATKLIQVVQGLIVFFVGADVLFRKYAQRITRRKLVTVESR